MQGDSSSHPGRNLAESILKLKKASDLQRQTFEKLGNDSDSSPAQGQNPESDYQSAHLNQVDSQSLANQKSSGPPASLINFNRAGDARISFPPSQPANFGKAFETQVNSNPSISTAAPGSANVNPSFEAQVGLRPNVPTGAPINLDQPLGPANLHVPLTGSALPNVNQALISEASANANLSAPAPANQDANKAVQSWGKSWGSDVPKGSVPDSDWGPPPKGGVWEEPPEPSPNPTPFINNYSEGETTLSEADRVLPVLSQDRLTKHVANSANSQANGKTAASFNAWQEPVAIQSWSPSLASESVDQAAPKDTNKVSSVQQVAKSNTNTNQTVPHELAPPKKTDIPRRPNWSPDAEQIETGTWQALAFNNEHLRAPAAMPASDQKEVLDLFSTPMSPSSLPSHTPQAANSAMASPAASAPNLPKTPSAASTPNLPKAPTVASTPNLPKAPSAASAPNLPKAPSAASAPNLPKVSPAAPAANLPQVSPTARTADSPMDSPPAASANPPRITPATPVGNAPIASPSAAAETSAKNSSATNLQFDPLEKDANLSARTAVTSLSGVETTLTIQEKLDRLGTAEPLAQDSQIHVEQIAKIENTEPIVNPVKAPATKEAPAPQQQKPLSKQQKPDTDLIPKITPVESKKTKASKDTFAQTQSMAQIRQEVKEKQTVVPQPKISPIQGQVSPEQTAAVNRAADNENAQVAPALNKGKSTDRSSGNTSHSDNNGLFNLDDNAIDQLFSENLGVNEPAFPANPKPSEIRNNVDMTPPPPPPLPPPPPPPPPPRDTDAVMIDTIESRALLSGLPGEELSPFAASNSIKDSSKLPSEITGAQAGKLFSIDDDMMDNIFSEQLGNSDKPLNTAPKLTGGADTSLDPAAAVNNPSSYKVAGIGRLDNRSDTAIDTAGPGKISSIGKFLLDGPDLEKIGKLAFADPSETKMRILTMEAATELKSLLQHIDSQPGAVGSIIIGHDQLLISNTIPPEMDAESLGQLAFSVYMNTLNVANKMGYEVVRQLVSKTQKGYLIIADFGDGLLVTVTDAQEIDNLIPLLDSINHLAVS